MKQVVLLATLVLFVFAIGAFATDKKEEYSYIGAAKCKMCHKSEKSGKQYTIWSEGPHAKAFETLASEHSMKIGKEMGIEDPQKSEKCLKCHAPSHAVKAELKGPKWDITEGVSCEDCHGPGSAYQKMSVMKAITAGEAKAEDYGLWLPNEEMCLKCHNEESPTYKPFKFEERVKKIAHPIPAGEEKK